MITRHAACQCGQLAAACKGVPVRISVCHCLECKRHTGSAFAAQARFPETDVEISGEAKTYTRIADSGVVVTYRFCPHCGSTIAYKIEDQPDLVAIPLGAFADPAFPAPRFSVYEDRKHAWTVVLGDDVEHYS